VIDAASRFEPREALIFTTKTIILLVKTIVTKYCFTRKNSESTTCAGPAIDGPSVKKRMKNVQPTKKLHCSLDLNTGGVLMLLVGAITAPVFNKKGFYDYFGHTSTFLVISKLGRL